LYEGHSINKLQNDTIPSVYVTAGDASADRHSRSQLLRYFDEYQ